MSVYQAELHVPAEKGLVCATRGLALMCCGGITSAGGAVNNRRRELGSGSLIFVTKRPLMRSSIPCLVCNNSSRIKYGFGVDTPQLLLVETV